MSQAIWMVLFIASTAMGFIAGYYAARVEAVIEHRKWLNAMTMHLRGATGRYKPENPEEARICKQALAEGASQQIARTGV